MDTQLITKRLGFHVIVETDWLRNGAHLRLFQQIAYDEFQSSYYPKSISHLINKSVLFSGGPQAWRMDLSDKKWELIRGGP